MTILKSVAAAVVLATPVLLANASAEAFTARQATLQGQGLFTTSNGLPTNFIGSPSLASQEVPGAADSVRTRDLEHHGRYFSGN